MVLAAMLGVAVILAGSYSAASTPTKKETRAEKLRKALEACKKQKPGSKRKLCERRARWHLEPRGPHRSSTPPATGPTATATGSGTATGTGTGTGTGTSTTTSTPGGYSATIIVHVYLDGGPGGPNSCYGTKCPAENDPLYVEKLGPIGEVVSAFEAKGHTILVAPGEYEVAFYNDRPSWNLRDNKVAVIAGQTVELTVYEQIE